MGRIHEGREKELFWTEREGKGWEGEPVLLYVSPEVRMIVISATAS